MLLNAVALAWPVLSVLLDCSGKTFSVILSDPKLWKLALAALIEISYNYLYEDVGLTKAESDEISKHRKFLDQLAAKGSCKSKRTLTKKHNLLLRKHHTVRALILPLKKSQIHLTRTNDSV